MLLGEALEDLKQLIERRLGRDGAIGRPDVAACIGSDAVSKSHASSVGVRDPETLELQNGVVEFDRCQPGFAQQASALRGAALPQ